MRLIGTLNDDRQLEKFVAFLVTKKIAVHIDREGDQPRIWIKDEDQVTRAKELLAKFLENPEDPAYADAVDKATELIRGEARKRRESRKLVQDYGSRFRMSVHRRAPLTMLLIVACIVLWFFQSFALSPNAPRQSAESRMIQSSLFRGLAFTAIPPDQLEKVLELDVASYLVEGINADSVRELQNAVEQHSERFEVRTYNVLRGEVWRLITPIFIHFGAFHLAFNLFALYQLGVILESRYGTLKLALVVLAMAAIPNFLQAAMPVRWDGSPIAILPGGWGVSLFGGISGVVFGLLGFAWIKSQQDWSAGFYIPRITMVWAIAWILLGVSAWDYELLGVNMANWAHGAGFVLGIMLGYWSAMFSSPRRSKES